ncbi:MAG: hypothetical protein ABI597_04330 [Gammaproteobacteria bacterium]
MFSKYSFFVPNPRRLEVKPEQNINMAGNHEECERLENEIKQIDRAMSQNTNQNLISFGSILDRCAQISIAFLKVDGFRDLINTVLSYAENDPVPNLPQNEALSEKSKELTRQLTLLKDNDMEQRPRLRMRP